MQAAAVFLFAIQCLNDEYSRVDTRIERTTDFALVRVAKPDLRGTKYRRAGDAVVYFSHEVEEDLADRTPFRLLRLYADRGGEWWQLHGRNGPPFAEDRIGEPAVPVVVERVAGLVAVTYTERSFHGTTARTVLLDFRAAKPRVKLLVECSDVVGRGCMGPTEAREPRTQLTCDSRLRCTSTQTQWIDWTTRTATRTFDLLTGTTFAPRRFDAITYASGKAYARAVAADRTVLAQRVVLDRIGPVAPVFELAPDSILFAGPTKEGHVGVRFFHLTPGNWREIPLTRLTDDRYPGTGEKIDGPSSLASDHTPDAPQLLFFAWNVEYNGKGRLIEVVAREGEARSLYWIMFDPAGRTSAIRLATDTPEFRHCEDQVFPPSVTSLGIPDAGLPAQIAVIHSWRMTELEKNELPKRCGRVGRLGWSPSQGWQPVLFDAPCTQPWAQPYATVLDDEGTIGCEIVKPR